LGFPDGGRIRRSTRIDGERKRERPGGTSAEFDIKIGKADHEGEFALSVPRQKRKFPVHERKVARSPMIADLPPG
jgi:hypothetical protein